MALTVTKSNFQDEVVNSDKPVLLDFWAAWCGPCRMVAPAVEALATEYDGKAVVGKVNVDEEQELAEQFKVMSIPSLFVMKNGEVVERLVGARSKEELAGLIEKHL